MIPILSRNDRIFRGFLKIIIIIQDGCLDAVVPNICSENPPLVTREKTAIIITTIGTANIEKKWLLIVIHCFQINKQIKEIFSYDMQKLDN